MNLFTGDNSDVSISAGKVANDGKHPLLEFAMSHFREIDVINNDDGKDKKKKKKKSSKSDWTWKDQVCMNIYINKVTVRL